MAREDPPALRSDAGHKGADSRLASRHPLLLPHLSNPLRLTLSLSLSLFARLAGRRTFAHGIAARGQFSRLLPSGKTLNASCSFSSNLPSRERNPGREDRRSVGGRCGGGLCRMRLGANFLAARDSPPPLVCTCTISSCDREEKQAWRRRRRRRIGRGGGESNRGMGHRIIIVN